MEMPFGKFKGRQTHETPRYYLRWLLENVELTGDLKKAVELGLEKKEYNPTTIEDLNLISLNTYEA